MAPLVVIRSGSKYVEYRESRAEWMRQQQLKLHDSVTGGSFSSGDAHGAADNEEQQQEEADFNDDDDDDEARFLQRRSRHPFGKCGSNNEYAATDERRGACSFPLGFSLDLHAQDGMRGFNCADCGNLVADRDDVVAKTFFGRTGKAFLMNNMYVLRGVYMAVRESSISINVMTLVCFETRAAGSTSALAHRGTAI